jgi:hypothetical protein
MPLELLEGTNYICTAFLKMISNKPGKAQSGFARFIFKKPNHYVRTR